MEKMEKGQQSCKCTQNRKIRIKIKQFVCKDNGIFSFKDKDILINTLAYIYIF